MWKLFTYDVITFSGVPIILGVRVYRLGTPLPTKTAPGLSFRVGTVLSSKGLRMGVRGTFLKWWFLEQRVYSV